MSEQRPGPVRYWKPDERLRRFVTGYHSFSVTVPPGAVLNDAFFPDWVGIRIALPGSPSWSLKLGSRTIDPVPPLALFGPTSYAGYATATGGTLLGVGILPFGWATLFGGDVSRFANRVVPLDHIDAGAQSLVRALAGGEEPAAAFDAWLTARLALRPAADSRIEQLFALLDDPATTRTEQVAETLEVTPRALAALTRYHFGFTPKLLLRRARFLRALSAVLLHPESSAELLAAAGYWDRSHFLRDSHLFLGCSIRDFNRRRGPLNTLAMRAREQALGKPV